MKKQEKKWVRIKPKFIKNSQGKTVQVYLDMKSYESMLGRIKELDAIKRAAKRHVSS